MVLRYGEMLVKIEAEIRHRRVEVRDDDLVKGMRTLLIIYIIDWCLCVMIK